jgi:acetyltransferase-like isoleucine patch superfamily enzyme
MPNVCAEGRLFVAGMPRIQVRLGRLRLGSNVTLRSDPRGYQGSLFGPVYLNTAMPDAEIIIGEGCRLNGCAVVAWKRIEIGKNCVIAANTTIMDALGHSTDDKDCCRRHLTMDEPAEVVIEDNVWIGLNCIILKGVRIGRAAIVAAGSVVTQDVPPRTGVGGVPARPIRTIVLPAESPSP